MILRYLFVFLALLPSSLASVHAAQNPAFQASLVGLCSALQSFSQGLVNVVQVRAQMIRHMIEVARYPSSRYHARHRLCTPKLSNIDKQEDFYDSGGTLVSAVLVNGHGFSHTWLPRRSYLRAS